MIEATVRAQYDRLAQVYDRRWRTYVSRTLTFLYDWGKVAPAQSILDIACGTGELERLILKRYPQQQITGIDLSAAMLRVAQQKCPTAQFQVASATHLPFATAQFDRVVCANAFHYFDPAAQALDEMRRVLLPWGELVILDWCRDDWLCQLCDWGLRLVDPAHRQCYTQAELHCLLQSGGFDLIAHRRVRFGWWGLMIVRVKRSGSG